ncbi:putative amino acid transporter [Trypanosoma grayi]|uniref:putative amino acid transporter n=1 Tax=Trypanosoma grayi TaxID=71804 RepID=UPI0004F44D0B|nr:putative amino acid transporter [Trypanosoma grayi]KEG10439.1 putative amino acid transporter [Trypanosoma grayi]
MHHDNCSIALRGEPCDVEMLGRDAVPVAREGDAMMHGPYEANGCAGLSADECSGDAKNAMKRDHDDVVRRNKVLHMFQVIFNKVVPYGGLLSSTFNLASATLGAGITSLPAAFNLSGVVMSSIYLIFVTIATVYSMNLLAKVIHKTGAQTFEQAARLLLGTGMDYFLVALVMFLCFGGSVAYIIITGRLLTPVLTSPGVPDFLKTSAGIRLMTSIVWLCFMLPLIIPRRINSLRYCSAIGVLFIVYFVVCVMTHSVKHYVEEGAAEGLVMVQTGNVALEGLSIYMFAFICQLNAFEIFHEMTHRTVFHFTLYSAISMTVCALLYFLAGFFGYLEWGKRVTDSVLTLYDPVHEPMMAVAYVGIVFKICVAFALHFIPLRDAMYHCLRWDIDTVPYWKHGIAMLIPAFLALLCGLFIPKVNTVLGLLGAFCGGTIGLIFPPLFYMYSGNFSKREVGSLNYSCTYLLLIFGVVAVVFGTGSTIYGTVRTSF